MSPIIESPVIESTVMRHLTVLSQEIGPRPVGTHGNRAAADYIEQIFQRSDLQTRRQYFDCPAWSVEAVHLAVGGVPLAATVNPFSPPCDHTAPIRVLSTLRELAASALTGRIAVLCGDLSKEIIAPLDSPVYLPEPHKAIGERLRQKQPLAIVLVTGENGDVLPLLEEMNLSIPSITVPAGTGRILLENADVPVELVVRSRRAEGASCNVIGTVSGTVSGRGERRSVLCAHYDTKFGTPGAFDNGSGVAVLLTVAEMARDLACPDSLEFVAFSGEEFNGLGDQVYLQEHGLQTLAFGTQRPSLSPSSLSPLSPSPGLASIRVAINVDGVGQRLGTNTVALMSMGDSVGDSMSTQVRRLLQERPGMVEVPPWPASNHYTFYTHGVPSIALGSTGGVDVVHRSIDTLEWLSPQKLAEVVDFVRQALLIP